MVKQVIGAPPLVGGVRMPLSKAVRAGDFIFVAGQIAFDSSGRVADGPIETQTRSVLDSIKAILAEIGMDMADIVKTTVWLGDPRDFGRFNAVYAEYFPSDPPARSTLRADLLLDVKIEIEAIAYAPSAP